MMFHIKEVQTMKSVDEKELCTVQKRTEKLLQEEPETRNSDKLLIRRYMKIYHNVDLNIPDDSPSLETIRRCRQAIQAQGKCRPVESVGEVRGENEVVFSKFFKS
jgi:hypothetical protein